MRLHRSFAAVALSALIAAQGPLLASPVLAQDGARDWQSAGNDGIIAGRKIVEHDNALAAVDQGMHHVAANIAGATGHQNGHGELLGSYRHLFEGTGSETSLSPVWLCFSSGRMPRVRNCSPSGRRTKFMCTFSPSRGN